MKIKLMLLILTTLCIASCGPDESETEFARDAVNPWAWSMAFGFNQGEVISGETRTLYLSGQTSVDENGAPAHEGDIRAQFELAFENVDTMLAAAGMDRSNVVRVTTFTTDMDGILANWDVYMSSYPEMGYMPPNTLIGIDRLFVESLMVEIEVVAVD